MFLGSLAALHVTNTLYAVQFPYGPSLPREVRLQDLEAEEARRCAEVSALEAW